MALPNLISSQRSLRLVESVKERALLWVQQQPSTVHRLPSEAPFRRLFDFWFASITWAVARDLPPTVKPKGKKFVSIGPTAQDVRPQGWKLQLLILLAVRDYGYEDTRSQQPSAIVELANRYAEAGAEALLSELESAREFAVPKLYRLTDVFTDAFKASVEGRTRLY
jgi:hypothetical protein